LSIKPCRDVRHVIGVSTRHSIGMEDAFADDEAGRGGRPLLTGEICPLLTTLLPSSPITTLPSASPARLLSRPVIFCLMVVAACTSPKHAHGSGSCPKLSQTLEISTSDLYVCLQITCGKAPSELIWVKFRCERRRQGTLMRNVRYLEGTCTSRCLLRLCSEGN
jgi:hypothetical protein